MNAPESSDPQSILRAAGPALLREVTRAPAPPPGSTVVAAVSGGADSVALLRLLHALAPGRGWSLVVATLDHGMRGEHGAADRRFVEELAGALELPCASERKSLPRGPRRGLEEPAREARHAFLRDVAGTHGASAITLGHTLDDQAETVLLRLGRGAGRTGISSMARWRPPLWRPLLGVRRARLRAFLARIGQKFRQDETNEHRDARRNRIRHEVLPALEAALGPAAPRALARYAEIAREEDSLLDTLAEPHRPRLQLREDGSVAFERRPLANLPSPLLRRILRRVLIEWNAAPRGFGERSWRALEDLVLARGHGRELHLPGRCRAIRERDWIVLVRDPGGPTEKS